MITPDEIYLFDSGEGIVWADTDGSNGLDEAVKYIRADKVYDTDYKMVLDIAEKQTKAVVKLLKEIRQLEQKNAELEGRCQDLSNIVRNVAHIGIDFGFGEFELEQKHIDLARKLIG